MEAAGGLDISHGHERGCSSPEERAMAAIYPEYIINVLGMGHNEYRDWSLRGHCQDVCTAVYP